MEKFARKCDATGRGMNEGYCFGHGELYFAERKDLIKHLRTLDWEDCNGARSKDITDDEDLLDFFCNEDQYYYTEWEEIDDDCFYDAEGNWYEC